MNTPTFDRIAAGALGVLRESLADPIGSISSAVYDTAQAVELPEHMRPPRSLDYLLGSQRTDGSWGPPDAPMPYRVVPTLAATAALLGVAVTQSNPAVHQTTNRALSFIVDSRCLDHHPDSMPDTVAVETIVPAQIERIAYRLGSFPDDPPPGIRASVEQAASHYSTWFSNWHRLRSDATAGRPLPPHIDHTVEVLGPELAAKVSGGGTDGPVACSPAATAAVLAGNTRNLPAAQRYITDLARLYEGALPDLSPISTFERIWIAAQILRAKLSFPLAFRTAIGALGHSFVRDGGLGMAPGFFLDCDITSTAVTVLHGCHFDADPLIVSQFEADTACANYYPGERNLSPTVNAHVLDALGDIRDSPAAERIRSKVVAFVLDSQNDEGSWIDKWHASPYYAASCCAPALARHATSESGHAVKRTRRWLMDTQRPDGSWGAWIGTLEETAYAIQTLLLTTDESAADAESDKAVNRGAGDILDNMRSHEDQLVMPYYPPLWHAKELFTPHRIGHATVLSTLHMVGHAIQRIPEALPS